MVIAMKDLREKYEHNVFIWIYVLVKILAGIIEFVSLAALKLHDVELLAILIDVDQGSGVEVA